MAESIAPAVTETPTLRHLARWLVETNARIIRDLPANRAICQRCGATLVADGTQSVICCGLEAVRGRGLILEGKEEKGE